LEKEAMAVSFDPKSFDNRGGKIMLQTVEQSSAQRELERFFVVAEAYRRETGKQAFMPACPVDTEWHNLLEQPREYQTFCRNAVGHDIRHEPARGEGEIGWTGTYERLFGQLPDVWFRDTRGILDKARRQKYLDTGVFYASWDCTPY
jgi:hypothetical protein